MQIMPIPSLIADSNMSGQQFHAVSLSGDNFEIEAITAVGDIPIGILQNKPNGAGEPAEVAGIGSTCKAQFGGTVQAGNILKVNASGELVVIAVADDDIYPIAVALQDGVDGQIGYVLVTGPTHKST